MRTKRELACAAFCCAIALSARTTTMGQESSGGDFSPSSLSFFESNIRPVLVDKCYECHSTSTGKAEGGLLLDTRAALLEGGDSGPAITPGTASESLLLEALRYESFEMPPSGRLDAATVAHFEEWIADGAADPRTEVAALQSKLAVDWEQASDYWSFQPIDSAGPNTHGHSWSRTPIDDFVYGKLVDHNLTPAPEAERAAWLRRVTFDLIGLPPTLDDLQSFLTDLSPTAYESVVERLLASPHYGERWGRHWLDLARYADTNGADENHQYPESWRYRDYVVDAFNSDKPYDRFVHEQLAGDLLPSRSDVERRELLTATGFLVIGPKMLAEQDKDKLVADIVDEQLDTVGKVFMGLTLGCSRCHDHKFDPITAEDYYALAGIFHSTLTMEHLDHVSQWSERVLPDASSEQQLASFEASLAQRQTTFKKQRIEASDAEIQKTAGWMRQFWIAKLAPDAPDALAPVEVPPELQQAFQGDSELAGWLQVSLLSENEFQREIDLRWSSDSEPSKPEQRNNLATVSWVDGLLAEDAPDSPQELVELTIAAIRARWQALLQASAEDPKSVEKLSPPDRRLFAKDAILDIQRMPGKYLDEQSQTLLAQQAKELEDLEKQRPPLPRAMAVDDASVKLVAVHVRGNHLQFAGEPLERRVPEILSAPRFDEVPVPSFPSDASGRLEFAEWLTHPDHPLTARVMVNRIWQGHFGEGLVGSSSNFGLRGDNPSHPELLDWLAREFQRSGWSIKNLHRQIVLSSTYRMAWVENPQASELDPENRLLWRQNRRRLEAEPVRDSLLVLAGRLDHEIGGKFEKRDGKYPDSGIGWEELDSPRRTLMLPINRAALNDYFSTFDYVDPAASLEKRSSTIVPHQTLFLLNHPLSLHAGWALAERVTQATQSEPDRIRMAYATAFCRYPSDYEIRAADAFIAGAASESELDAWAQFCRSLLLTSEFLYVD